MQYILSQSTVVINKKRVLVKTMRREKTRYDRMRLRKSILGKEQMFGRSQMNALSFAFAAWRAWWRAHVGTKRAFILKQGLLQHEYDLARVGREVPRAEGSCLGNLAKFELVSPQMDSGQNQARFQL